MLLLLTPRLAKMETAAMGLMDLCFANVVVSRPVENRPLHAMKTRGESRQRKAFLARQ